MTHICSKKAKHVWPTVLRRVALSHCAKTKPAWLSSHGKLLTCAPVVLFYFYISCCFPNHDIRQYGEGLLGLEKNHRTCLKKIRRLKGISNWNTKLRLSYNFSSFKSNYTQTFLRPKIAFRRHNDIQSLSKAAFEGVRRL